jgi:predicted O-linked N-acetylglucosamine transferase (SPINDLY family)
MAEMGRLSEAEISYRQAVSLEPEFAEACGNLGDLLDDQGRGSEAEACYRRALALKPDLHEAHLNLGFILAKRNQLADAIASYKKALELQPNYPEAHNNLGLALNALGRHAEAEASFHRALALKPDFVEAWSNLLFVLNYDPDRSAEKIYEAHREYDARFGLPLRGRWPVHGNSRELGRRLKVGYVSPDFRRHAVSSFLEPLLARHDKAVVQVYAYAEVKREDEVSARLKGYVDEWVPTVGLSDEALAERIGADGIDILVDLAGHTAGNRLGVFARKPAPIQVTWLGYPGSSGLTAMDYRLTDSCADPQGSEAYYTETLLRLPDSLWCYRLQKDMPEVTALPAQQNGYVTFGSFNNFNKINNRCIELWARLLRAVPSARLLMVTIPEGEPRQRLAEQFVALGVSAERLEFQGRFSGGEFYRMIQRADIALDPVTVNGATTTCECLMLGVPVLTLVGERFLQRAGLSILSAAGYSEFAAATPQGYIDIATQLAGDIPRLAEIRARMRAQVAASPLVDEVGFARKVEAAYREMFGRWASKQ